MPYHADVIGSLLRPRYLSEARAVLAAGQISNEEFKRVEDRAVDQAIANPPHRSATGSPST
jgi:methionine synthase II (cobalamin-independent)